jgi:fido (protein-threonine AMPylation protein)
MLYFSIYPPSSSGNFAFEHIRKWHRQRSGRVYDWAGRFRNVNLTRMAFFTASRQNSAVDARFLSNNTCPLF